MKHLVIFADYGLDDAAATVSIFSHQNLFSHISIVPIGGNVPPAISFRNCITLLSNLEYSPEKVSLVDTLEISQNSEYLASIHGNDGMGDIFAARENAPTPVTVPFNEWLETLSGEEILLSLGPMTVVKPVLEKHPTCSLVIMGGCVDEEPNFNGYEFNQALDVSAFAFCTNYPHAAITLDTCRVEKLNMRRLSISGDDVHSRILRADQKLSISRGEDGCYVWDDVAACYVLFPERFVLNKKADKHGNLLTQAVYISEKEYFEA